MIDKYLKVIQKQDATATQKTPVTCHEARGW